MLTKKNKNSPPTKIVVSDEIVAEKTGAEIKEEKTPNNVVLCKNKQGTVYIRRKHTPTRGERLTRHMFGVVSKQVGHNPKKIGDLLRGKDIKDIYKDITGNTLEFETRKEKKKRLKEREKKEFFNKNMPELMRVFKNIEKLQHWEQR